MNKLCNFLFFINKRVHLGIIVKFKNKNIFKHFRRSFLNFKKTLMCVTITFFVIVFLTSVKLLSGPYSAIYFTEKPRLKFINF